MSFDPAPIAALRELAPGLPRGIVAERHYEDPEWRDLDASAEALARASCCTRLRTRPHFLAYRVTGPARAWPLSRGTSSACRCSTWTVRSDADRARAERWADQMIFEGFRP